MSADQFKMLDDGEIPLIAASFTLIAAFLFLRRFNQKEVKGDGRRYPPPIPILPIFGAILRGGMTELPKHFMISAEQLGPVYSFAVGKRLAVVLNSYDAIFDAFMRHSEGFADRTSLWTEAKVLNPELRGIIHRRYTDAFKKYHKLSLSILREFGFGVQSVTETRILQEVETMIEEIRKQNGRPFNAHWRIDKMRTACTNLLSSIEVGIEFIKSNPSEPTFVGRFLEIEGPEYDHQDLVYLLRDMVFGATETVAMTMMWAIVELANNPAVLKRLQSEIDEMIPGDRLPSLEDKSRLPYTEAVILEVMRRRTLIPVLVPHATYKDTRVLGYDVPKECMVIGNIYSVHMDRQFWNDPETFTPERFLDENNKITIINSRRVIPFGLGKRSCIGEILGRQSVFLFLTSLVQHFDIQPPEGQKSIKVKEVCVFLSTPSPFEVRLIPRVKSTQN